MWLVSDIICGAAMPIAAYQGNSFLRGKGEEKGEGEWRDICSCYLSAALLVLLDFDPTTEYASAWPVLKEPLRKQAINDRQR